MKMRAYCILLPLTLLALGGWVETGSAHAPEGTALGIRASSSQDKNPRDSVEGRDGAKDRSKQGPISVFADVEEGWQKGDVHLILRHFGEGKVSISIEGTGPSGGAFSRSQSLYLFKDLFKYTITKKFEFVQYRNVSDGRAKVYAVAERSYKRNDDGRLFTDKIYVSLQQEDDQWVISEIKSIR